MRIRWLFNSSMHFLDVINSGVPPRVTVEDGLRNIEVIEAIKAAAKNGRAREIVPSGQGG